VASATRDPLGRALELGLAAVVVLAPLPFGAVTPRGRLALEAAAGLLGLLWTARAALRPTRLPSRAVCCGLLGLLGLGMLQAAPLSEAVVGRLSPASLELRRAARPPGAALAAEERLLGLDPSDLDPAPSLSVSPPATAASVRTGAALALLLLVAFTVASSRGLRVVAFALLLSAAFQGLYGTLVLASGHARIWDVPKRAYLDCATGTFVNRNHFAGFLAGALPAGLALTAASLRHSLREGGRRRWTGLFSRRGSTALFLGLLVVLGVTGLLLSYSRAGIALGLAAAGLTVLAGGSRGLPARLAGATLVLGLALVPLMQIGAERMAQRYARADDDLTGPGGRARVWSDTLGMAAAFPLLGTGFGTFAEAYPLFRSPDVRLRYDHAHNDLVQALAEGGAAAALLLALLAIPVAARLVPAMTGALGTLATGMAAGLAAMLLHALVDFNFHIPSNAAVAAVLAGALLGAPWTARS
jgi:putative inorganic carbon (HCO3(-)) transporter